MAEKWSDQKWSDLYERAQLEAERMRAGYIGWRIFGDDRRKKPRSWLPNLWWRLKRRIGWA